MQQRSDLFFTGITGIAGSWLAAEALRRGWRVQALVRGGTPELARLRVERALALAEARPLAPAVELLPGDLCQKSLDLEHLASGTLKRVRMIVHCAACTQFKETEDGRLWRTNVAGTRRVLELAGRLRVPLVHISTAYVAGRREGLVLEGELSPQSGFNNDYERTKYAAECAVLDWSRQTGLPAIILRPGILVGQFGSGAIARFNSLYDCLGAFERIAPLLGSKEIRVQAQPEVTKNLVPVDAFARAAWHLIERGRPGCYHLTHPAPLTISHFREVFSHLFNVGHIRLVDEREFIAHPPTQPERIYKKAVALYQPYFQREPVFDRTHAASALREAGLTIPDLDEAYFARVLAFARSANWRGPMDDEAAVAPPSSPAPALVERYFTGFLADRIGRKLLPDLHRLTATFAVKVAETHGPAWVVRIDQGEIRTISRNGIHPACTYRLNMETFGRIISGRLEPQQAFFERRVELDGDLETGLRLAFVLGAFFRQHACHLDEA